MKKNLEVFQEIPCLTEKSSVLSGEKILRTWFATADRRFVSESLHKFVVYNKPLFEFLGIIPSIIGTDRRASIFFQTSSFIGTVPLLAPDSGKQIGDFVVTPKYISGNRYETYIEILNLLEIDISPEVIDSIPLASGKFFHPPMYFEAIRFIKLLYELVRLSWRKFDNVEKLCSEPLGQVNWRKYSENSYKVEKRQQFNLNKNVLSEFHNQFSELKYVYDLCKLQLFSPLTPIRIRNNIRPYCSKLDIRLSSHIPKKTDHIQINASDSPIIIKTKKSANKILNEEFVEGTAWRVNFSEVFEKYVQYLFERVSKEIGGKLLVNPQLGLKTNTRYSWEINYLEPDAIFRRSKLNVVIDAKYKSHLFNKYEKSDSLRDEYRKDLHQILAYSSFDSSKKKASIICYPSNRFERKRSEYSNKYNKTLNAIELIGIPLDISKVDDIISNLSAIINDLEFSITITE